MTILLKNGFSSKINPSMILARIRFCWAKSKEEIKFQPRRLPDFSSGIGSFTPQMENQKRNNGSPSAKSKCRKPLGNYSVRGQISTIMPMMEGTGDVNLYFAIAMANVCLLPGSSGSETHWSVEGQPIIRSTHTPLSYLGNEECSTTNPSSISKGYVCNTHYNSCESFLTFKSKPSPQLNYDTPITIANLLDSQATNITHLNKLPSPLHKIPNDSLVIVPVPCSCSGSIYQHNTHYTIKRGDSYTGVAKDVYQGLTTCQALIGQNYYDEESLAIGSQLLVPVRCACPTAAQEAGGVASLLVYMVESGDSFESVAKKFGVDVRSVLKANRLTNSSQIYPFKPILVPLKSETCRVNSLFYFCSKDDDDLDENRGSRLSFKLVIGIGVGSGTAFLVMLLLVYKGYQLLKKRRHKFDKEKFFKQNGGSLLEKKLQGMEKKVKVFTKGELKRATDNYSHSRFLGQGGYGTVYKGNLQDGTVVAVKRSNQIDKKWIEHFINEVIALSEINHRNVVKLFGCCLETKLPLLVYEFVPNRTLFDHIHKEGHEDSSPLSWEIRLRIASEVAGAIAYMHSAASIPIIHRDIKSSNILLDHNYNAKVSDFGTSRFVPYDQSHLTTKVQGTLGYIDPEYFRSSILTEKSDVYSFGVLMVELLTGKQPFSFARDEGKNLLEYFISLEKENQLVEILDGVVAREAKMEDVNNVAKLAIGCLRLNGKRRPTMKQVFLELEGLRKSQDYVQFVEESQSRGSFANPNASTSYEEFTDDNIVSLEIETL